MQYTAFIGLHVYKDEFSNKFNRNWRVPKGWNRETKGIKRVHMRDDREYLDDKLDVWFLFTIYNTS